MADENWTVVGRRRSARLRKSGAAVSPFPPSQECDEDDLLLRLKRSMARVQESAFFQRLLLQAQTAPVLDLLSIAASSSSFQGLHRCQHDEVCENQQPTDKLLSRFAAEKNPQENCGISSPLKDSTAENALDCLTTSMAHVCRLQTSEISQTVSTVVDITSVAVESKPLTGSRRHYRASDATSTCSTHAVQCHTVHWSFDVVLYGLGSIVDSEISRCQLALILLLRDKLSWVGLIEVYDPILTPSECKVIKNMGCLPVAVDEKGRRSVSSPTLFYMPHCEDWLYDNVLQANWAPHTLRQIVILGNSFQDYQERWSSPVGRKSVPPSYVLQYQQAAKEVPLDVNSSVELPGFNNMSWHFMI